MSDMKELNLRLVATGVRPGCLGCGGVRELTSLASKLGLRVRVQTVRVHETPRLGRTTLVTRDDAPPVGPVCTHEELARVLGLPCGSRLAWADPGLCVAFAVYVHGAGGACAKAVDFSRMVTSFWCRDERIGRRWFQAFRKRARVIEAEVLAPRNERFACQMTKEVK